MSKKSKQSAPPQHNLPDSLGHFGDYGGRFVAETLQAPLIALEHLWQDIRHQPDFQKELTFYLNHYAGRPSPLYFAERLTAHCQGAKIYFKRDELNHTGSHKINNCLGQVLLARAQGKKRLIAETGAGQHGVAVATVAARFGFESVIYMGKKDMARQKHNLYRMHLLGAQIKAVESGAQTLKDAMNEALRDWVSSIDDTFYIIGTAAGPHPYPQIVREFQSVIGREAKAQILESEGRLPNRLVACIGGGSNAIGLFHPFLDDDVELYGVEAAGKGLDSAMHAASIAGGKIGILHGHKSYYLQNDDGQIIDGHSISAGLDYPGIGPEHAFLHDHGRVHYISARDDEALSAAKLCARLEGILPALEPAHALARVIDMAREMARDDIIIMNMCGRGDKDIATLAAYDEIIIE